jgi:hypothetical protein
MIMIAKDYVETNYKADVIYGDSVMPYTPITYKINDNIYISTFENIEGKWKNYDKFKANDSNRTNKEQLNPDNMYVWTDKKWAKVRRIIRHKTIKKIYRITTSRGLVDVTEDHSLFKENREIIKPSECKVGLELLHSKPEIIEYDKEAIYNFIDNVLTESCVYEEQIIIANTQVQAQEYFVILELLNYNVSIEFMNDYYILTYSNDKIDHTNKINKIEVIYDIYHGYVYDIETENGAFHGGIGHLILKNTDSIFCKFPLKDDKNELIFGKEALTEAIKTGKDVAKNIAHIMPPPQKLNYEKCLYPFILFSKKRYVGNLYETDINDFKQKSMGIVLKRRDNANIVKKIYGGIIDIILNKQDLEGSVKFLKEELNNLVNGKADIKDLILSKTLRSSYKDPTKIAHKVLADRIGIRDAGNKPACNDRIAYIYIKVPNAKLQGDKIETPEFIEENGLQPDYLHYITNQIMKPVLQLYALCLTDLSDYKEDDQYWNTIEEELKKKPLYQDDIKRKRRLDNLKLMKVQEILFDEFINRLKEPILKETRKKKVISAAIELPEPLVKIITDASGEIRIVNSKVKEGLCYSIKIMKNSKNIYSKENKEGIKDITKDKLLDNLLLEIYKKFTDIKIEIKINYKEYVKNFNMLISKYNEFKRRAATFDSKNNDIGLIKLQKELQNNLYILEISDRIALIA